MTENKINNEQKAKDFYKKYKDEFGLFGYIEYNCINLSIPYKKIKLPIKKEITEEWFLNKINDNMAFKNISDLISKNIAFKSLNVYPASYGIGVFLCFGYKEALNEDINKIEEFLNKNEIEFKSEYSLKNWVYRFIISKKEDNLKKLL